MAPMNVRVAVSVLGQCGGTYVILDKDGRLQQRLQVLLHGDANPIRIVPQFHHARVAIDDAARADAQPFHAVFAETLSVKGELLRDQIHSQIGAWWSLKTLAL